MKRAFIGFSSCVAYDYKNRARKTPNDERSSPNPILYGSTGLLLLYDEIWFACRSLCPNNMRALPYVRFLDQEFPDVRFDHEFETTVGDLVEGMRDAGAESPARHWREITAHVSRNGVDNHTHGLTAFGRGFMANQTDVNLAIDVTVVDHFPELKLEVALNPLTSPIIYSPFGYIDRTEAAIEFSNVELTHRLLTFGSLYDYVNRQGPYHPVIDEMRNDPLLTEFRKWVGANDSRLDNQDIRMIERDVNERITDLRIKSMEKYVSRKSLIQVPAQMLKSAALSLVPPANGIAKGIEILKDNRKSKKVGWQAFIALSKDRFDRLEFLQEKTQ